MVLPRQHTGTLAHLILQTVIQVDRLCRLTFLPCLGNRERLVPCPPARQWVDTTLRPTQPRALLNRHISN
jgi:hypothetical protein